MEKFRKKLKRDVIFGEVFCAIYVALILTLRFLIPETHESLGMSYTIGFFGGICAVILVSIISNSAALKNEEKLKKLYIKENDERTKAVGAAAGKAAAKIVLAGLSVAMLVAANINKTAFFWLLGAVAFTAIVMTLTKAYYNKKL